MGSQSDLNPLRASNAKNKLRSLVQETNWQQGLVYYDMFDGGQLISKELMLNSERGMIS